MKILRVIAILVSILVGYFVSVAFRQHVLIPLAPSDADIGFAAIVAIIQMAVWFGFVVLAGLCFRAMTKKSGK